MKRLYRNLIVVAALGILPAVSSADTFLLFPGVAGDASDPSHKNWIRVSEFAWGVAMPVTTSSSGGGMTVGRASGERLKLTIPSGIWSREFLSKVNRGTSIPEVVIDHINPDGRPAYRVTIGLLLLTKYASTPSAKAIAQDELEGQMGNYKAEFYAVAADGRITSTTVSWNFVTNTGSP